jgi:hypothetical protein
LVVLRSIANLNSCLTTLVPSDSTHDPQLQTIAYFGLEAFFWYH